jgi:hypothetical protein
LVASTSRAIGSPICLATHPDKMLPKLPDGTANETCSSFERVAAIQPLM